MDPAEHIDRRVLADEPEFTDHEAAVRWRTARRAALDHVLSLIADAPWSDGLVLRGSMLMPAWVGERAREPADLDFVVLERLVVPIDPLHPYPYIDQAEDVQQWPEAAGGAARYEMWTQDDDDLATGGLRPIVPPEDLHWVVDPTTMGPNPPYADLAELVRRRPRAAPGVLLDADEIREDGTWTYTQYDAPGVRLLIPWHAEGLPSGEVGLDFARDESLPQAPVLTLVPRADGGRPSVMRTASRELALAWKLLWLHGDCAAGGRSRGKDLYDAVVLAEADGTSLSPRLLRRVLHRAPGAGADAFRADSPRRWDVDWTAFLAEHPWVSGTADEWLDRLVRALRPVLAQFSR